MAFGTRTMLAQDDNKNNRYNRTRGNRGTHHHHTRRHPRPRVAPAQRDSGYGASYLDSDAWIHDPDTCETYLDASGTPIGTPCTENTCQHGHGSPDSPYANLVCDASPAGREAATRKRWSAPAALELQRTHRRSGPESSLHATGEMAVGREGVALKTVRATRSFFGAQPVKKRTGKLEAVVDSVATAVDGGINRISGLFQRLKHKTPCCIAGGESPDVGSLQELICDRCRERVEQEQRERERKLRNRWSWFNLPYDIGLLAGVGVLVYLAAAIFNWLKSRVSL